jgi:hypothetical protein
MGVTTTVAVAAGAEVALPALVACARPAGVVEASVLPEQAVRAIRIKANSKAVIFFMVLFSSSYSRICGMIGLKIRFHPLNLLTDSHEPNASQGLAAAASRWQFGAGLTLRKGPNSPRQVRRSAPLPPRHSAARCT